MSTNDQFCEQLLYAFVNMCTTLGLTKVETTDIINAVVLGYSSENPLPEKLDTWDISKKSGDSERLVENISNAT